MRIFTDDEKIEWIAAKIKYFSRINQVWIFDRENGDLIWNKVYGNKKREFRRSLSQDKKTVAIWRYS